MSPDTIPPRLAALKSMPTPELKAQWRELFDSEPPPFNRDAQHLCGNAEPNVRSPVAHVAIAPFDDIKEHAASERSTVELQKFAVVVTIV